MSMYVPTLIMIGMEGEASLLLRGIGFAWEEAGFENINIYNEQHKTVYQPLIVDTHNTLYCLLVLITSPDSAIDIDKANAWIPSPSTLAEMEKGDVTARLWSTYDLCSFGARAFLRLGRESDAYELARLAVAPEQGTLRKTTLSSCHSILGQVTARRGDMEEADGHFARSLTEAKASRLPMLELLAARDWRDHLLIPTGRKISEAEAIIDAACLTMKKTRMQLDLVLGWWNIEPPSKS